MSNEQLSIDWRFVLGVVCVSAIVYVYTSYSSKPVTKGLKKGEWREFKLGKRVNVSHNTVRFIFDLPSKNAILGLPVGKHILVRVPDFKDDQGEYITRPYTPVSSDNDLGFFELVIKIYETGILTKRLDKLKVGDVIEAKGPEGRITYTAPGTIELERPLKAEQDRLKVESPLGVIKFKKVALIAGGTGITPILQVVRQILRDDNDDTDCYLIFANRSIDDILLREELEELAEKFKKFHVYFTLDKAPEDQEWNGGVGFVTQKLVQEHLPPPDEDLLLLECGPPVMMTFLNKFLGPMGYKYLSF